MADESMPAMADESMAMVPAAEAEFEAALVLYVAVHKTDRAEVDRMGMLPTRRATPKDPRYIGLRQDPTAAVERYGQAWSSTPENELDILEVKVSKAGVAFFGTSFAPDYGYAPVLHKKFWLNDKAGTPDWGCWHFVGDLPLVFPEFLQCRWL